MRTHLFFLWDCEQCIHTLFKTVYGDEKKSGVSFYANRMRHPDHNTSLQWRWDISVYWAPGLPTFPGHVRSFRATRKILATKKYSRYRKGVAWHFRPEQSQLIPPVKLPANSWVNVSGSLFWTHFCSLRAAEHHNARHTAEPWLCGERNVNVTLINKRVIGK